MAATEFEAFDDFLNHSGPKMRGGSRLKSWHDASKLDAWLHTKRLPVGVWRHSFPQVIIQEDKDTRKITKLIYSLPIVCHEDESVLKEMYERTPSGERKVPPVRCPVCKLIEYVRSQVAAGTMSWIDELFRFEGASDPKHNTIIRAGGLYGAFGSRKLTDDEKKEMKSVGIYPQTAWKFNCMPKLSYVFPIVDNNNIAGGVQITTEPDLLKKKVVATIIKEKESNGAEEGDPTINPYCIRFVYREEAEDLKDKYDALRINKIQLTEEVKRLITSDAPDLSQYLDPFNAATMRSRMEKHLTDGVELPFDTLFSGVQAKDEDEEDEDASESKEEEKEEKPAPKKTTVKKAAAAKAANENGAKPEGPKKAGRRPVAPPEDMGDPCDACKAPMKKGQLECGKCGAKYADDDGTDTGDDVPFG